MVAANRALDEDAVDFKKKNASSPCKKKPGGGGGGGIISMRNLPIRYDMLRERSEMGTCPSAVVEEREDVWFLHQMSWYLSLGQNARTRDEMKRIHVEDTSHLGIPQDTENDSQALRQVWSEFVCSSCKKARAQVASYWRGLVQALPWESRQDPKLLFPFLLPIRSNNNQMA